eukprot:PhF_6_TR11046/c0_g1_i1/m.17921
MISIPNQDHVGLFNHESLMYKCKGCGDTTLLLTAPAEYVNPSTKSLQTRNILITDQAFYLLDHSNDIEIREPLEYILRIVLYTDAPNTIQMKGLTHTIFLRAVYCSVAATTMHGVMPSVELLQTTLKGDAEALHYLGVCANELLVDESMDERMQVASIPVSEQSSISVPANDTAVLSWSESPLGRHYVKSFLEEQLKQFVMRVEDNEAAGRKLLITQEEVGYDHLSFQEKCTRNQSNVLEEWYRGRNALMDMEADEFATMSSEEMDCTQQWLRHVRNQRDRHRYDFESRLKSVWSTFGIEAIVEAEAVARKNIQIQRAEQAFGWALQHGYAQGQRAFLQEESSHRMFIFWTESTERIDIWNKAREDVSEVKYLAGSMSARRSSARGQSPETYLRDTTTLCHGSLAHSTAPHTTWTTRYYILTPHQVCVRKPHGIVPLFELRSVKNIEMLPSTRTKFFDFVVTLTNGDVEKFRCDANERRIVWVSAIKKASEHCQRTVL